MGEQKISRVIGNKPKGGQTHVKVRMLEDTLEAFKSEIGRSVSIWWVREQEPRIQQLIWASAPWYKKLLVRLARSRIGRWFTRKFGPKPVQNQASDGQTHTSHLEEVPRPEKVPETADSEPEKVPETPSEERQTRTCAKCGKMFIVHGPDRICPVCQLKAEM